MSLVSSRAVLGLVPRGGPRRATPEVGENLVTLLELVVPSVEVNVEHNDGPGRQPGQEKPATRRGVS